MPDAGKDDFDRLVEDAAGTFGVPCSICRQPQEAHYSMASFSSTHRYTPDAGKGAEEKWPADTEWEPWTYYHGRERFRRYRVHSKDGIDGKYKGWIIGSEFLTLEALNALQQQLADVRAEVARYRDESQHHNELATRYFENWHEWMGRAVTAEQQLADVRQELEERALDIQLLAAEAKDDAATIVELRQERDRYREALLEIRAMASVAGYDTGHEGIYSRARAALTPGAKGETDGE